MKPLLAIAALALCAIPAHADDILISVSGSFSEQGENFSVSYEADLTGYTAPYGLVAGTLNYSSSSPVSVSPYSVNWPEGGLWTDSSGDKIVLLLFMTPGCGTSASSPCVPGIGPNEVFAPGFSDSDLNAFANGVFEFIPAGQSFSTGMFGDVQVSFVPESSSLVLLSAGLLALASFKRKVA